MNDDIVDRLRIADEHERRQNPYSSIHQAALEEILRLRSLLLDATAELDRVRNSAP